METFEETPREFLKNPMGTPLDSLVFNNISTKEFVCQSVHMILSTIMKSGFSTPMGKGKDL